MNNQELFSEKKSFLDYLYYKIGIQHTNFSIAIAYTKQQEQIFSKWRTYLDAQADMLFIEKANQRTILFNEIVFDLDEGDMTQYKQLINKLKENNIQYYAYATKSGRARHIHTYWKNMIPKTPEERAKIREFILKKYGCDTQLKNDKHMIQLEYSQHFKTKEIKTLYEKSDNLDE